MMELPGSGSSGIKAPAGLTHATSLIPPAYLVIPSWQRQGILLLLQWAVASAPPLRTCSLKTQKPGRTCAAAVPAAATGSKPRRRRSSGRRRPTDTTLVPSRGNKRRPALDRRAAAGPLHSAATAPPPQGRTHGRGAHEEGTPEFTDLLPTRPSPWTVSH